MKELDGGTFDDRQGGTGVGGSPTPEPVLSVDDLVLEIGLKTVQLLEKQKVIEALQKKVKELESFVERAKALEATTEELRKSNRALSDKNLEMDKALTTTRQELDRAKTQIRELERKVGRLEERLKVEQSKEAELVGRIEELEKKLKRKKK